MGEPTAKTGIDVAGPDDCRPHWAAPAPLRAPGVAAEMLQDLHWKRPGAAGSVTFPGRDRRGAALKGGVDLRARHRAGVDWLVLMRAWIAATAPFAALLLPVPAPSGARRAPPPPEAADADLAAETRRRALALHETGVLHASFRAGPLNTAVSGLTAPGWATFLGPPHAAPASPAALSAAGFAVEPLSGGLLIRATETLDDALADPARCAARRRALAALFPPGAFLAAP